MLTLTLLTGCLGLNPKAVPTNDLWLDDGESKDFSQSLSFAVIGDTRPWGPGDSALGRAAVSGGEEAVMMDVSAAANDERVQFALFMGNVVDQSTTGSWKQFAKDWGQVVSGSEVNELGHLRIRAVSVAGTHDREGDEKLKGWGAAFPGIGADIGLGRVASWYSFDQVVNHVRWRFLVVDSDKAALGSRWDEQLAWLPKVSQGDDFDNLLVFLPQPRITLAKGAVSNPDGAVTELLDTIEDTAKLGSIKAVFAGGTGANEVYLPTGKLGELYVDAGNSGAPAALLSRWGHAAEGGFEDLKLEPIFDVTMMKKFGEAAEQKSFPEEVQQHAQATGSYTGFPGEFDPRYFPLVGWWKVDILGQTMELTFRMVGPDGQLSDVWIADYQGKLGWKTGH